MPKTYREGSFAMGATKWQTIYKVIIPSARSGILASFILGMGRAIGETMAVIMVAGNALRIPTSILDPLRTLTSNIALELAYATGDHRLGLFSKLFSLSSCDIKLHCYLCNGEDAEVRSVPTVDKIVKTGLNFQAF